MENYYNNELMQGIPSEYRNYIHEPIILCKHIKGIISDDKCGKYPERNYNTGDNLK